MPLSEEELLACVEPARARLVRLATSMLGDQAEAEDAVQDSVIKALVGREKFRGEADACSWVQRICINTCQDTLRRRNSTQNRDLALRREALWRDPAYTVDPERVAVALEDARVLRRALSGLTPAQNRAVVLHDIEGWTEREIAELAGLPLATVKSHLRRGRQALVTALAEGAEWGP
ncbi:MAG: RNA polymerase sigma factor [Candidatus Dormibacteraeota bacterium]|nr:RNA polymerase sigma factor [Candidatus Dormibacteraeota bacterium]